MGITTFLKVLRCSTASAMSGFTFKSLQEKVTDRKFVVPLVYSLISIAVFALIYALIGYKNIFETNEPCTNEPCPAKDCSDATCPDKDKNIENSIVGSIMLQSNAMGLVVPINNLGNFLMTTQAMLSWFFVLAFIYLIVDADSC